MRVTFGESIKNAEDDIRYLRQQHLNSSDMYYINTDMFGRQN